MHSFGSVGVPRPGPRRAVAIVTLATAIAAVLGFGCREEIASDLDRNRPPDTYLTGVPAESTTAVYRLHLYWHGNDPDGKVVGFEYAVTDSLPENEDSLGYAYTTRTDSIFIFQVSGNQQVFGHRFYVRAIDNEGAVDPEPAWTFFGVVDLVPPTPLITLAEAWKPGTEERMELDPSATEAEPDTVPAGWNVRFAWSGVDGDRVIDENGEILVVGEVVQYEWQLVGRDVISTFGDRADTTIVYTDLTDKKYVFTIRAVDDAGFAGLDPAKRVFLWNHDPQTFFRTGVTPAGDTLPHFIGRSDAYGEHEFFHGDTLPLVRGMGGLQLVDIEAVVHGFDVDPITAEEIAGFQYRPGSGVWRTVEDSVVSLTNLKTADLFLQARAIDGLGRRDGTPAMLEIHVNRSPVLIDTLGYDGGEPILQFPMTDEEIRLETILANGGVLRVKFLAVDPDSTTEGFGYQWRTTGFLYKPQSPLLRAVGTIAEYDLELPEEWLAPGTYLLGVKVAEVVPGQESQRFLESEVPFHIIE